MRPFQKYSGFLLVSAVLLMTACHEDTPWQWGPFTKADAVNPVLYPLDTPLFKCPVRDALVLWQAKDVFNPAAVVRDGKVWMLYRAEDTVGHLNGTSRIGLASSDDGLHFERRNAPVLYPDHDQWIAYEWEGGCEDPRIVEDTDGNYYMTYTAWNGDKARLCVATSTDLINWTKHGPCFRHAMQGKYLDVWSKSGAIVCAMENERLVARKVKGRYWMYWGDTSIFLASSDDLINWIPLEDDSGKRVTVFGPRKGFFDSDLVEPGPPPLITSAGILMIYNGRNGAIDNDRRLPEGTYSAGQALLDPNDPSKIMARSDNYFITPDRDYEISGQVNRVCFVEGLVWHNGRWLLYYGTADSRIAAAFSEAGP